MLGQPAAPRIKAQRIYDEKQRVEKDLRWRATPNFLDLFMSQTLHKVNNFKQFQNGVRFLFQGALRLAASQDHTKHIGQKFRSTLRTPLGLRGIDARRSRGGVAKSPQVITPPVRVPGEESAATTGAGS